MAYGFILGCEGAPPSNFPDDIPRCMNCIGGSCGILEIGAPYLADIVRALETENSAGRSIVDVANQMNIDGAVPNCPNTGANRYCTSTLVQL